MKYIRKLSVPQLLVNREIAELEPGCHSDTYNYNYLFISCCILPVNCFTGHDDWLSGEAAKLGIH